MTESKKMMIIPIIAAIISVVITGSLRPRSISLFNLQFLQNTDTYQD